jgi:hypothetical protein
MAKTRKVRLSTGFEVPLDGDLLAIIEALYKEVTLGNVLNASFETMRAEILSVLDQMSDAERREYLAESLFLNSVTYENEMLSAYVRRLAVKAAPASARKASASKASKKKAR